MEPEMIEYNDCSVGIPYGDLDGKITASSEHSPNHSVLGCKLGKDKPNPNHAAAWCAKKEDKFPWIQVELPKVLTLSAVSIQGRGDANQYVTKFRVLVAGEDQVFMNTWEFAGNTNHTTPVKRSFPRPVRARFARIQILEYIEHPSMRFDLHFIPE